MKWDIAEHCATPQKYCAHPLKSQTPQATKTTIVVEIENHVSKGFDRFRTTENDVRQLW